MNFFMTISYIVLCFIFFVPTAVYGGVIGNRIVNNEFKGNFFKKLFAIPLFVVIGAGLFPFTYLLMIAKWDDISNDIDNFLYKKLKI